MKHTLRSKHITILSLIAIILIGCSNDSPINTPTSPGNQNTPPIIDKLLMPDEASIQVNTPGKIAAHDKDLDMVLMAMEILETTAEGTRIHNPELAEKCGYIHYPGFLPINDKSVPFEYNFLSNWSPAKNVHKAQITIKIKDVFIERPITIHSTIGKTYFDEFKGINETIVIRKTITIREAKQIIPGEKMGEVHIGQHINDIKSRLGPPIKNNKSGFKHAFQTTKYPINFRIYTAINKDKNVVLASIIQRGRLRTNEGNGLGSISHTKDGIYAEFGKTNDIRHHFAGELHVYKEKGIAIQYENQTGIGGVVIAIAVFNEEGYHKIIPMQEERPDMSKVTIIR